MFEVQSPAPIPEEAQFPKPLPVAASVAVFARDATAFLLIRRRFPPFEGSFAFPGGYLDVDREDLYQTAARELKEETGLSVEPSSLELVDVRSSPNRDPRGHTIDVGFFCEVASADSLPRITAEAFPQWVDRKIIDDLDLAFDHATFWSHVKHHADSAARQG